MRIVTNLIVLAVVILFIYIFASLLIRDFKNKKLKEGIQTDGVSVLGTITGVRSRSGGNSGFINITVKFNYVIENGTTLEGEADTVIDAMKINDFQPGEKIPLSYSKKEPHKYILTIPKPNLRRK
ncbi:TPA: hypothetical protein QIC20_000285 [Klebsiella aerogenes]|uniref:DUF3592 domain-containing protein n=1 Tax=Klebsiella TaxID=570 RepID=UPI0005F04B14|nr:MULTISPECIES: DUF3592 domain-containing protein [Klebsiella]EKW8533619.1 hypothetical protein [Klebsiella aerogenes]ELA2721853.1 hypothetical protein [Klebsiella aerogenes]ELT7617225.1 hypothetical protein [Klebsiella aerogenes]ELY3084003.1 hypothetical protein [Klebsiella aerogenes]KJO49548.1 hypothetical protein SR89_23810 [Klebsiella aerogenes]